MLCNRMFIELFFCIYKITVAVLHYTKYTFIILKINKKNKNANKKKRKKPSLIKTNQQRNSVQ